MSRLSERDRRALRWLAVVVALGAIIAAVIYWPGKGESVVGVAQSVPAAEKRLTKLRGLAAAAPGRREVLDKINQELARREKGMIQAETVAQAQAQVLQIVRRVASNQNPAVVLKSAEFGAPRAFGDAYAEVVMTVTMESGIDQIINLLADLGNQPELIAVHDLQLSQVTGRQKLVPARLTIAGVAPRRLAPPAKKGGF
ncbi:MAG: hypothetical protein HY858_03385 [Candidatus Solibacter usitatus]|nr:hypothetical protein [Candidatus Solibacter usitatus]